MNLYKIIFILLLVAAIVALIGCGDPTCPVSEQYQDGHRQVTWPDGSVTFEPIWRCP